MWIVEDSEFCVIVDIVLFMILFFIFVCRLKKILILFLRCLVRVISLIRALVFRKKVLSFDIVWWFVRGFCRGADFWWFYRRRESVCEVNY